MLHRSIAFTVTALVTGALLAPQPASATAAGETCQGRPATIVGTGPNVVGTPGDDVIVSGTSMVVNADAGNDLICITGPDFVRTDAGPGDDVVDTSVTTAVDPEAGTFTDLGTGQDRFLGSPVIETVHSNGVDDEVSTGPGRDRLLITITDIPTAAPGSYDGGGGTEGDTIMIYSAALDLEVALGESIVVDGMQAATLTGFQLANVAAPRVVLRGDASPNLLSAWGCEIEVDGQGGKDTLDTLSGTTLEAQFPCTRADRTVSLSGGGGDDVLAGGPGDLRLSGGGGNDQLVGGEGADHLVGGAGRDRLRGEEGADRLLGGSGNDRLEGVEGNDRLVGGAGRDRANGGLGRDVCDAEIERSC